MAKSRTLNEIRQTKEYQRALDIQTKKVQDNRTHPCSESTAKALAEHQLSHAKVALQEIKTLSDQGGEYTVPSKGADPVPVKGENFYKNPFEHAEVDKAVDKIVEDLQPHLFDTIFQMICDEMNDNYVFDSTEYLTQAGLELFEDEWFEFYHENHGKIMYKLLQNLK